MPRLSETESETPSKVSTSVLNSSKANKMFLESTGSSMVAPSHSWMKEIATSSVTVTPFDTAEIVKVTVVPTIPASLAKVASMTRSISGAAEVSRAE